MFIISSYKPPRFFPGKFPTACIKERSKCLLNGHVTIALCHDRFFYCALVPNSIFLKKNIDPAHFSFFFKTKGWRSISQAIVSKENASHALFFQHLAESSIAKKISIHIIIRWHVKHDAIDIYFCSAHEQRSADMESSNLLSGVNMLLKDTGSL